MYAFITRKYDATAVTCYYYGYRMIVAGKRWVGWSNDSTGNKLDLVFEFNGFRMFREVKIHASHIPTRDVKVSADRCIFIAIAAPIAGRMVTAEQRRRKTGAVVGKTNGKSVRTTNRRRRALALFAGDEYRFPADQKPIRVAARTNRGPWLTDGIRTRVFRRTYVTERAP